MKLRLPAAWYWFACGFMCAMTVVFTVDGRYAYAVGASVFAVIDAFMGLAAAEAAKAVDPLA